jgi:hypothetical protein
MAAKPQVGFSDARDCAPGPQGGLNRPSFTISLLVGGRRRPIDGLSMDQTESYIAKRGGRACGTVIQPKGMTGCCHYAVSSARNAL